MRLNSRRNSQISILKNQTRTTRFTVNFHQAKYSFLRFKLKQISSPTVHHIKIVDKLDTVNFARANKRWLLDNPPTIYIIARFEYLFHNGTMKHVWRFHERVIKEFSVRFFGKVSSKATIICPGRETNLEFRKDEPASPNSIPRVESLIVRLSRTGKPAGSNWSRFSNI